MTRRRLHRAQLSPRDQLSCEVFQGELSRVVEGLKFPQHWLPIGEMDDLPTAFALLASGDSIQPFKSVNDYDNFLGRARDFTIIADTAIANMRKGMAAGVTQPRVIMEKSVAQMEALLAPEPNQGLFFRPVLATLLAIHLGFSAVLGLALLLYLAAALAAPRQSPTA